MVDYRDKYALTKSEELNFMQMEALGIIRRNLISTNDFKENKTGYRSVSSLEVTRKLRGDFHAASSKDQKAVGAWNSIWTDLQHDGTDRERLNDINEGLGQTHRAKLLASHTLLSSMNDATDDGVRGHMKRTSVSSKHATNQISIINGNGKNREFQGSPGPVTHVGTLSGKPSGMALHGGKMTETMPHRKLQATTKGARVSKCKDQAETTATSLSVSPSRQDLASPEDFMAAAMASKPAGYIVSNSRAISTSSEAHPRLHPTCISAYREIPSSERSPRSPSSSILIVKPMRDHEQLPTAPHSLRVPCVQKPALPPVASEVEHVAPEEVTTTDTSSTAAREPTRVMEASAFQTNPFLEHNASDLIDLDLDGQVIKQPALDPSIKTAPSTMSGTAIASLVASLSPDQFTAFQEAFSEHKRSCPSVSKTTEAAGYLEPTEQAAEQIDSPTDSPKVPMSSAPPPSLASKLSAARTMIIGSHVHKTRYCHGGHEEGIKVAFPDNIQSTSRIAPSTSPTRQTKTVFPSLSESVSCVLDPAPISASRSSFAACNQACGTATAAKGDSVIDASKFSTFSETKKSETKKSSKRLPKDPNRNTPNLPDHLMNYRMTSTSAAQRQYKRN